jgi:hypothetical protein
MKKKEEDNSEFEKFSETTKRLLSVSKEELSRREAEWKKERKRKSKATWQSEEQDKISSFIDPIPLPSIPSLLLPIHLLAE